jgi:hypothetical protein
MDFIGLALALSFLEAAIWGVGVTKGHHWRIAPRFRPILGLAGVGLLVLVAADVLTNSMCFHEDEGNGLITTATLEYEGHLAVPFGSVR